MMAAAARKVRQRCQTFLLLLGHKVWQKSTYGLLTVLLGALTMWLYLVTETSLDITRTPVDISQWNFQPRMIEELERRYDSRLPKDEVNGTTPHKRAFKYLVEEAQLCSDHPDMYIISYVHSAPNKLGNRQLIRDTWGNVRYYPQVRMRVIFIFGAAKDEEEQEMMRRESQQFRDILQLDFVDSYKNLSYKGVGALQWITEYCQGPRWILKSDDDMLVNIFALSAYLHYYERTLSLQAQKKAEVGQKKTTSDIAQNNPEPAIAQKKAEMVQNKPEPAIAQKKAETEQNKPKPAVKLPGVVISQENTVVKEVELAHNQPESEHNSSKSAQTKIAAASSQHKSTQNQADLTKKQLEPAAKPVQSRTKAASNSSKPTKIMCAVWYMMPVLRGKGCAKWCVTEEEWPENTFPPYCSGSAFIIPTSQAPALYHAYFHARFLWVDDAYISGVLPMEAGVGHHPIYSLYELNHHLADKNIVYGNRVFCHHPGSAKDRAKWWGLIAEKEGQLDYRTNPQTTS